MIRLIQRRLIIPRGDTGSFSIPVLSKGGTNNIAVFTIFDETTRTKMFQKIISGEGDVLTIAFTHSDTVNLKPGKYVWDIKYYKNPEYIDDELVNGEEIDSYYAGFSLPVCEIRETADNYLVSPEAPTATLSPEQLEIVTGAIHSLNEAIRKTQENVEHYPEIRDEVWYVWDAELGDYVSTNVRANGIVGNGIASAVLNDDYTLTLNFTDGTSFTSTSIRGQRGNGIEDIVLNNDFTLTITYTDGDSYVTPSIRGPIGATPQFSIGTVQDGAVAAASITGTAENPVLNLTLPNAHVPTRVSQLENDANYAVDANYVHTDNNYTTTEKEKLSGIAAGAEVNVNADWNATGGDAQILNKPTKVSDFTNDAGYLTTETDPTVPAWAKAANKPSYTAAEVGATTEQEVSGMIAEAIGQINSFDMAIVQALPTQNISTHTIYLVPKTGETNDVYDEYVYINNNWEMVGNTQIDLSNYALKSELPTKVSDLTDDSGHYTKPATGIPASDLADGVIPDVPVQDVQVNDVSMLQNGVARIKVGNGLRIGNNDKRAIMIADPNQGNIRLRSSSHVITPSLQHMSTFYGLAWVAGDTTQAQSTTLGQYTDEAKSAIQTMLDVPSKTDIPTQVSQLTNDAGYLTDDTDKADVIVNTASGAVASFSDGADNLPVQDLTVQIEPVQAGSGEPSPENVRPITGWTGVNLTVSPTTDAEDGQTYSISFGSAGTVYGGSLDVTTGVLTVDRATITMDGSQSVSESQQKRFYTSIPSAFTVDVSNQTTYKGVISDKFQSFSWGGLANASIGCAPLYGHGIAYKHPNIDTAGDWKVYFTNNPTVFSYELATPQTYQLTPTEIRTLLGQNNIWANTGDTAVTYRADTKLFVEQNAPEIPVQDVQVNGVSVLDAQGVANVPVATPSSVGVLMTSTSYGTNMPGNAPKMTVGIEKANDIDVKASSGMFRPIVPFNQHASAFYGLAKAAGSDEKNSTLPVGQYTESAKSAISEMLNGSVSVSGTTPTINALPGIRYICGEVMTIDITTSASGIIGVVFTSGSTPAVLTVTPPSGMTMKWANGFDPDALEADTTYEINIADGCLGVAGTWT